jgi:hypothetical protein
MGLSRLLLVNPKRFPDDEAVARAAGADDILAQAQVCTSLDAALADTVVFACAISARQRNLGPPALQARAGGREILARAGDGRSGPAVRQRNRRSVERRGAALPAYGLHPGQSGVHLAQPGFGGATAVLRVAPGRLRQRATGCHQGVPFASPPASQSGHRALLRPSWSG